MSLKQVSHAVTHIDHVTQANATQTEALAATVQALDTQAQQLEALVGRFKLSTPSAMGDATSMPDMPFPSRKGLENAEETPETFHLSEACTPVA